SSIEISNISKSIIRHQVSGIQVSRLFFHHLPRVRLLPESISIRYIESYKCLNPPGLGGCFYSVVVLFDCENLILQSC
ncbi:MAG: hypothetical protein ACLFNL_09965, partial [Bacteroidales bacterium]